MSLLAASAVLPMRSKTDEVDVRAELMTDAMIGAPRLG
jgi:hypothetical protein